MGGSFSSDGWAAEMDDEYRVSWYHCKHLWGWMVFHDSQVTVYTQSSIRLLVFRPYHSTTLMRPIITDGVVRMICLSVCQVCWSVCHDCEPCISGVAEPVQMQFGLWTWVGPRNHALDGWWRSIAKEQFWGRKGAAAHYKPWAVQKQLNWSRCHLGCGLTMGAKKYVLDGMHVGAIWQIHLNHLCAVAMRPYVKLLSPLLKNKWSK